MTSNTRRFGEPGTLTAALNWYRALDLQHRTGVVPVPTLFVWGTEDLAVSEAAAVNTASYVSGPYAFERLQGMSQWLLDETPIWINTRLIRHLASARPR